MERPYKNQDAAKGALRVGAYVLFSYAGCAINSGTVEEINERTVRIADINGEGGAIVIALKEITLYRDTQWDEEEPSDWICPVCGSEAQREVAGAVEDANGQFSRYVYPFGNRVSFCPDCRTMFFKGVDE